MRVGVPREIKVGETRVAMTPAAVRDLVGRGHDVLIERSAGHESGFSDADYARAGARTVAGPAPVWNEADVVVKVKEPQAEEYAHFREDLILFCYLHLASDRDLTTALRSSGTVGVAYETVVDRRGRLALLAPMSRIAGGLAVQVLATGLFRTAGGRGILVGGMPGVEPARVLVLGGGMVGRHAALTAARLGAEVVVLDTDVGKLEQLDAELPGRSCTLASHSDALAEQLALADAVVGAVLVPGARAPKLIARAALKSMRPGALLVDVSIDQGGCAETSAVTTHDAPSYVVDDVIHYCVGNMPAAVPRTATAALSNATFPYVCALVERRLRDILRERPDIAAGVNVFDGHVVNEAVADSHHLAWTPLRDVVGTYTRLQTADGISRQIHPPGHRE